MFKVTHINRYIRSCRPQGEAETKEKQNISMSEYSKVGAVAVVTVKGLLCQTE